MEEVVPFLKLTKIEEYSGDYSRFGDDYIFARLLPGDKDMYFLKEPIRLSGLTICVVLDGELSVEINSSKFELQRRSLMVLNANNVLHITHVDWTRIEAYVLFISPQLISDLSLDLNAINMQALLSREPTPIMNLSAQEERLLAEYMDLLHHNAYQSTENVLSRNIARSLIQATFYQLMQITSISAAQSETVVTQMRHLNYVQEFMRLVQKHHFKERSLAFYADKLYISPKYLSRIIKEATGRSAAEWIDRFVLLEAKNMLRFSNKNIQQVAYALNFSTQSSFGKFFKHLTGMSPSEYQKT